MIKFCKISIYSASCHLSLYKISTQTKLSSFTFLQIPQSSPQKLSSSHSTYKTFSKHLRNFFPTVTNLIESLGQKNSKVLQIILKTLFFTYSPNLSSYTSLPSISSTGFYILISDIYFPSKIP